MAAKFSNIMDSKVSLVTWLTIVCCLIIIAGTSDGDHCGLAFVSFATTIIDAAVFIGWFIWVTVVNIRGIEVRPMAAEPKNFLNIVSFILFLFWILTGFFPVLCGPWLVLPTVLVYIAAITITFTMKART